ncbi:uncharacterized protein GLRG_11885 [Colletotrichum graminicola M1.001]|uniref:NACHT domain-containing protein n=1 Tax=Colletotrichum graminicola (strain M1.001 / M2 / FGSC 10212) TaxID=645133 RepID=E3R0V1_COLGM|nr:uncharacterized protein GLRG_11885 [Colletotrichum graminicola M1.001]EFQ36739.1 hypothetical protein GLRG_11885 [Colletotrichum graminicola M1.001]
MAELAAIGLVSNLLQFTELGVKLFIHAREAYRTGTIVQDEALRSEVHKGEKIYKRIWASLEQALKTLSNQKTTAAFEQRLVKLKYDLQFYLVGASVQAQKETKVMIERLKDQNDRQGTSTTERLDRILIRIETLACSLKDHDNEEFRAHIEKFKSVLEEFHQAKAVLERQHDILKSLRHFLDPREGWKREINIDEIPRFSGRAEKFDVETASLGWEVQSRGKQPLLLACRQQHAEVPTRSSPDPAVRYIEGTPGSHRNGLQITLGKSIHMLGDSWGLLELMAAFDVLASNHNKDLPVKFCFFIDGLDEYTGGAEKYHGQFEDLLATLYKLASLPSVKLCVSSRPWPAFNESLGLKVGEWHLQVEDLTRDDIKRVVMERLSATHDYKRLSNQDPRCSEIPAEIVQRAQGVWYLL